MYMMLQISTRKQVSGADPAQSFPAEHPRHGDPSRNEVQQVLIQHRMVLQEADGQVNNSSQENVAHLQGPIQ
jgi:hypothetical protein